MDILLGFAIGVNRQRAEDFQRAMGRLEIAPEESWVANLRAALFKELPRFRRLAVSVDQEVSGFAGRIVSELGVGSGSEPSEDDA